MSVDRGRDKLACMAAALACTGMSLQERLIVPGSPCGIEKYVCLVLVYACSL
jgi:hypothetical protein